MANGFAQMGSDIGGALASMGQSKLAGQAMRGDMQAMSQLSQLNPQMAAQIQDRFAKQQQQAQAAQIQQQQFQLAQQKEARQQAELDAKRQERMRQMVTENLEIADDVMEKLKSANTYEEYKMQVDEYRQNPVLKRLMGDDIDFLLDDSPRAFQQLKTQGEGAFAGNEMKAQIYNAMVLGVNKPEFRKTPEYAIAWKEYTKPKIINTPEGQVIQEADVDPRFKPPEVGALKAPQTITPEQMDSLSNPESVKGKLKYVPGTRKLSQDQKDYNKEWIMLNNTNDSLQEYQTLLKEVGPTWARTGVLDTAAESKLKSAFTQMTLDLKDAVNLGVLTGDDYSILMSALGDPTSLEAQLKGPDNLLASAGQVQKGLENKLYALNSNFESVVKTKPFLWEARQKETKASFENQKQWPNAPSIGAVEEGMQYKGGNPYLESSWEAI